MPRSTVKLDRQGIAEYLKSQPVARVMHEVATDVERDLAIDPAADVVVDDYVTDRAASSVTIRDPRAKVWQARDGVLTRAAAAVGLEVTDR